MVTLSDYSGREQSYVKHFFLESYLERLVYKVASRYRHIVFVDGFAGSWQSANETLEDTSFGIALNALRRAKKFGREHRRPVTVSAFLVERNRAAYKRLAQVQANFPEVKIKPYNEDFLDVLPDILRHIPKDAFTLFFVDPKGWRVPLAHLKSMLLRRSSEVIFNFMFEFINRAANIKDPNVVSGLNELIPHGNWRAKLEKADGAATRKAILVEAFHANLIHFGGYKYVAETPILRSVKDRTLYCLFYATHSATGIEVFRDCQVRALHEQSKTRATTKIKHVEERSGQREFFQSLSDMAPDDDLPDLLNAERNAAKETVLRLTPEAPDSIRYQDLWPLVLALHVVRKPDVNKLAAHLRRDGKLLIPDWAPGKHVPQATYLIQRPKGRPSQS